MTELTKYLVAGVINTLTGYGIFWLLLAFAGSPPELANAIGYAVALGVAYFLNRLFVFTQSTHAPGSLFRFVAAFCVAFLLNQVTLVLAFRFFGVRAEIAQVLAMTAYTVSFYLLNKHFVFRMQMRLGEN